MSLLQAKTDLTDYLAKTYITDAGDKILGQDKFNSFIDNPEFYLNNFSMGNVGAITDDLMLITISNMNANRTLREGGQLGMINWGYTVELSIDIKKQVKPSNAGSIGDIYIDALFKAIQYYIYDYKTLTPANPNLTVSKYFINSQGSEVSIEDLNSINSFIINATLTYEAKNPYLNPQED